MTRRPTRPQSGYTLLELLVVPAVLGLGIATQRIRHGQLIRVDGDNGVVALLDE